MNNNDDRRDDISQDDALPGDENNLEPIDNENTFDPIEDNIDENSSSFNFHSYKDDIDDNTNIDENADTDILSPEEYGDDQLEMDEDNDEYTSSAFYDDHVEKERFDDIDHTHAPQSWEDEWSDQLENEVTPEDEDDYWDDEVDSEFAHAYSGTDTVASKNARSNVFNSDDDDISPVSSFDDAESFDDTTKSKTSPIVWLVIGLTLLLLLGSLLWFLLGRGNATSENGAMEQQNNSSTSTPPFNAPTAQPNPLVTDPNAPVDSNDPNSSGSSNIQELQVELEQAKTELSEARSNNERLSSAVQRLNDKSASTVTTTRVETRTVSGQAPAPVTRTVTNEVTRTVPGQAPAPRTVTRTVRGQAPAPVTRTVTVRGQNNTVTQTTTVQGPVRTTTIYQRIR